MNFPTNRFFPPKLQKQYIFLYRALLDVAQFGNTEITFKDLPSTIEQLKQRSNDSRDQCKLEIEFEVGTPSTMKLDFGKS